MEREPEIETNCEILWCKINITGSKSLHIGAYYRPHEGDQDSLVELGNSLERLGNRKGQSIIIAGDMNSPDWNWNEGIV